MKYTPYYTNRIKRQLKALKKRGYDMKLFKEAVDMLLDGKPLPPRYNDHPLKGDKRGYRDCHILPKPSPLRISNHHPIPTPPQKG
jgi:mRNA interferase YafQ